MLQPQKDELLKRFITEKDIFTKSKLLENLIREAGMRLNEIARLTDLKPSYLSHLRRISRIPDPVNDGYYSNLITPSHVFILARLKNNGDIMSVYEEILSSNLSALQTETLVREKLYSIKKKGEYLSAEEKKEVSESFSQKNEGAKLDIIQTRIKSKLIITIQGDLQKTNRELRKILEKLA